MSNDRRPARTGSVTKWLSSSNSRSPARARRSATIRDKATFEAPNQFSEGMEFVLVNGVPVIENGKMTGALPGKVLRGPGYVP